MKRLVALLLMGAAMAWGQPAFENDDPLPPRQGDHQRMMTQLKLTDEQEQKIDRLRADFEKKQITTRAQLQSLRIDLRQLFKGDAPDRSKVESKMKEVDKLASELRMARVGHWFDVYALLTPEQQKIWKEHPMMRDGGRGRMMMRHRMSRDREDGGDPPMRHGYRDN